MSSAKTFLSGVKYEDISILSLMMAAMSAIEKVWTSCGPWTVPELLGCVKEVGMCVPTPAISSAPKKWLAFCQSEVNSSETAQLGRPSFCLGITLRPESRLKAAASFLSLCLSEVAMARP